MKATYICLLFSFLFFTGNGQMVFKNSSLIGKWQLVEAKIDPGDGSGKWEPVKTTFTLKIKPDSTVKMTGTRLKTIQYLC